LNIVINAISIKEGGSLLVLRKLLPALIELKSDITFHVIVNPVVKNLPELQNKQIKILSYPWAEKSFLHLLFCYKVIMPDLLAKIDGKLFFSITNYLPFKLKVPNLLLVQHAGHFSPEFEKLYLKTYKGSLSKLIWYFKKCWVKKSILRATLVTVQKETLAQDIFSQIPVSENHIKVIPHGLGNCSLGKAKKSPINSKIRIGYITKYGVQKNFTVLLKSIKELIDDNRDVELILTLDETMDECRQVLNLGDAMGLNACLINYSKIRESEIQDLYDSLHLFAFPSICESFGFPMVEAMSRGVPLLVSDISGNRDIANEAGIYFDQNNSHDLALKIKTLMDNSDIYNNYAEKSIARAQEFSWEKTATATLEAIDNLIYFK